jgi:hypothetical protein
LATGHKDWRQLRRYTNLKVEDLLKLQHGQQPSMEELIQTLASVEPSLHIFGSPEDSNPSVSASPNPLKSLSTQAPFGQAFVTGPCHSRPTTATVTVTATGGGKGLAHVLAPTQRPLLVS